MRATRSNRILPGLFALALVVGAAGVLGAQTPGATAQKAAQASSTGRIVASQVGISRGSATLDLELSGSKALHLALKKGHVTVDGRDVGSYDPGGTLDKSWRALLNAAMETPNDKVQALLEGWSPPSGNAVAQRLRSALLSALGGSGGAAAQAVQAATPAGSASAFSGQGNQDVQQMQSRIRDLESLVQQLESKQGHTVSPQTRSHGYGWTGPFRSIWEGFTGIISTLALYVVLLGLGFAAVFFGRKYLEGVADTARHHTLRSWGVGFAASFLALPVFILGMIALAVSIVGIPALIAWVPLFPVAVMLAALFGYLAVGHAMGEAMAERRLQGTDWFSRGNSYYYIMTGLGMLLALFLAASVVRMAGPWLGFVRGTLTFLGVVLTWAAITIGFGAVLLSRAGTRPVTDGNHPAASDNAAPALDEDTHA